MSTTKITVNELKLGNKTAENVNIEIDKGLNLSNPKIRWNDAAEAFQFSNDGNNFFDFGSGSGSGEINYIENSGFETDTAGWALYADAAQETPEDGTGGTADISISAQSSTILRGGKSLQLVKDAADRQGQGFSYDFVIKGQDVNKKNKIQFDFKTDEDAAFAQGDIKVFIYDVTNAQLITPVDTDIPRGQNIFQTSWVSTDSLSYRLIFHIASTNASAYDIFIDDVIVGPGAVSQGAALGGWTAYAPTTQGFGTLASSNFQWRRTGDSIEIMGDLTAGTSTGDEAQIGLPNNLTVLLDASDTVVVGQWLRDATLSDRHVVLATSGDSFLNIGRQLTAGSENPSDPKTGAQSLPSGQRASFSVRVPVAQYQGQGIVPMLAEDNLSSWTDYSSQISPPANSTVSCQYRRVGQEMEIFWQQSAAGASTVASPELPNGFTIDTAIIGTSAERVLGNGAFFDNGTAFHEAIAKYNTTTNLAVRYDTGTSLSGIPSLANGDEVNLRIKFPVTEWRGSQNSLVGYTVASENNVGLVKKPKHLFAVQTAAFVFAHNTQTDVVFGTVVSNTFASGNYNSSTGVFTASESGLYTIQANFAIKDDNDNGQMTLWQSVLFLNGSQYLATDNNNAGVGTNRRRDSIAVTLTLSASDQLKFRVLAFTGDSGNVAVDGTSANKLTNLSITKIG